LYERLALAGIAAQVLTALVVLWLPIEGIQYQGFIKDGKCVLQKRYWVAAFWVIGDTMLSVLLLLLFVRPLREMKTKLGESLGTVSIPRGMKRTTEKNRNLLMFTMLFTLCSALVYALKTLDTRTVIFICAIDRLVTLQCITMTFSYDRLEYFYCYSCFLLVIGRKVESFQVQEKNRDLVPSSMVMSPQIHTPSVKIIVTENQLESKKI